MLQWSSARYKNHIELEASTNHMEKLGRIEAQLVYFRFIGHLQMRVVCPNFVVYKYKFYNVKNSFATILNVLSVFEIVSAFEW